MADPEQEHSDAEPEPEPPHEGPRKRPRPPSSDTQARYPRKRSSKACHVCRARKTKCDNVRPTCGFCASVNIQCSYDVAERDHSSFDPASLEILRQLSEISSSQEDLLQIVRSVASPPSRPGPPVSSAVSVSGSASASVSSPNLTRSHAHTHPHHLHTQSSQASLGWDANGSDVHAQQHHQHQHQHQHLPYVTHDWFAGQSESDSTTPAASAAAARWFDLLTNDAREAFQEADAPLGLEGGAGFLDPSDDSDYQGENDLNLTPLQRATRIVDNQPPPPPPAPHHPPPPHPPTSNLSNAAISPPDTLADLGGKEESMWQAPENIRLLHREQVLFENFLRRICSWIDLFDPASTFSTRVPHLAVRNAGLLNAILALSSYHRSLDPDTDDGTSVNASANTNANASANASAGAGAGAIPPDDDRPNRNTALQYYYQTLHYVQKAMRYPSYQNSQELMATTLIVSTYEMLRGSRRDWEQHLQGVFWILRSRQIEVEAPSLESTTWWAWLRQDIWVALREGRKTYSTWAPKKGYAQLSSHELASRALWILAQVVNFCAAAVDDHDRGHGHAYSSSSAEDHHQHQEEGALVLSGRLRWAKALGGMLREWRSHLTVEFSSLPATSSRHGDDAEVFRPRLIHPQCFGLAMQIHHVSQILLCAHEPCLGGLAAFVKRQKTIQNSIEMVCGIGMTLTEDASSMLSSQCLFIAGIFMQDPAQKKCVLEMLRSCRERCGWPTPSLGSELERIWDKPDAPLGGFQVS